MNTNKKLLTFKGFIALLLAGTLIVMAVGCKGEENKDSYKETTEATIESTDETVSESESESETEVESESETEADDETSDGRGEETDEESSDESDSETEIETEVETESDTETESETQNVVVNPTQTAQTTTPTEAPTAPASAPQPTEPVATNQEQTETASYEGYRTDLADYARRTLVNNVTPNLQHSNDMQAECDRRVKLYAEAFGQYGEIRTEVGAGDFHLSDSIYPSQEAWDAMPQEKKDLYGSYEHYIEVSTRCWVDYYVGSIEQLYSHFPYRIDSIGYLTISCYERLGVTYWVEMWNFYLG